MARWQGTEEGSPDRVLGRLLRRSNFFCVWPKWPHMSLEQLWWMEVLGSESSGFVHPQCGWLQRRHDSFLWAAFYALQHAGKQPGCHPLDPSSRPHPLSSCGCPASAAPSMSLLGVGWGGGIALLRITELEWKPTVKAKLDVFREPNWGQKVFNSACFLQHWKLSSRIITYQSRSINILFISSYKIVI